MPGKLEIEIAPDGTITSKTSGITGSKCTDVDKFLKDLGDVRTKFTAEYYNKEKPDEVLLTGN